MVLYQKLWYFTENYGTLPKTMELWFTMKKKYGTIEKIWFYTENYGTIISYSVL